MHSRTIDCGNCGVAIPFRFMLLEDFALSVIAEDFAVDEAHDIELLRTELRHNGGRSLTKRSKLFNVRRSAGYLGDRRSARSRDLTSSRPARDFGLHSFHEKQAHAANDVEQFFTRIFDPGALWETLISNMGCSEKWKKMHAI